MMKYGMNPTRKPYKPPKIEPLVNPNQQGWECPKCGSVYAPWNPECRICGPKLKIDRDPEKYKDLFDKMQTDSVTFTLPENGTKEPEKQEVEDLLTKYEKEKVQKTDGYDK
jgi:hypothetical protein